MDDSEAIVEKLLSHMGFSSIIYEPDGNVPPDFLVDGRIAIEVRRLNQNHDAGSGMRGLEETSIPLWQKIERLGVSMGLATGNSWFLFFRFNRPVPEWRQLEPKLKRALASFQASSQKQSGRLYTEPHFELDVLQASQSLETFFCMGGMSDRESGGWVVAEMLSNIAHCAAEKTKKVAPYRSKYEVWWLALTNYTGFGLGDYDKQQLLTHVTRPAGWDKILLVSPSDPTKWVEF